MKICFSILFLFLLGIYSLAQDSIFVKKQELFAKYLMKENLFGAASLEYERLLQVYPNNVDYLSQMIRAYILDNKSSVVIKRLDNLQYLDQEAQVGIYQALIKNDELEKAIKLSDKYLKTDINNNILGQKFVVSENLLMNSPKNATLFFNKYKIEDQRLSNLIKLANNRPQKSKSLAGIMSSVLPGSGRLYARDAKDAIFSFIFIGATAYQGYRRFNQNGIKSVGGWIYSGFSFGFYLANIYGSVKAADRYNKKSYKPIYDGTKNYFDTFYSLD
jgi:hypothetical protein